MDKKKIFLIVGRSCVGKTSTSTQVCEQMGLTPVKSYTTRPRRFNETKDNTDHYFINKSEVGQYSDDIAAWTKINEYEYFTTREILNKSDLYVIDPHGITDLKRRCKNEFDFVTIYLSAPISVTKYRAECRGEGPEAFEKRYETENAQFEEIERDRIWDYYLINNGTFEEASVKMEEIIRKEI